MNTTTPFNQPIHRSAEQIEALAERRVKAQLGWIRHATVYACVIGGLALVGLWQGRAWPIAPALGWGFGLAMHALAAYGPRTSRLGVKTRERMLQRERARLMSAQ